ncbi:MAG: hypothetical protein KDD47_10880 [Acidobacteria bacterium]|nr:hypothetical protein [Acidobacteriota bacterium]
MKLRTLLFVAVSAIVCAMVFPAAAAETGLRVDAAEAEAALAILHSVGAGEEPSEAAWQRLFATDGFRRLGDRERSMERPFGEEEFRALLSSEESVAKALRLEATLAAWKEVDFDSLAGRVLEYLPPGARLRATIYPVIKPKGNSFVFDVEGDPAIFLYLDPQVPPEKFANTVLHELHHIGFGGSCPPPGAEAEIEKLPEGAQKVLKWLGAFGEGFAMLAAAGGPEVHPHALSPVEDRQRWDRDVARFDEDRKKVEVFFLDLLAGRLDGKEEIETARSFYGIQGPWYTVGWKMAVTIEKSLGREALIEAFCDPRELLPVFNRAEVERSGKRSTLWSEQLLTSLGAPKPPAP